MLLSNKLNRSKRKISNPIKNKICSLQVQIKKDQAAEWVRASCSASCSGSFTVEAALVLPLMIFILCAFLYFLLILNTQTILYEELTENARKAARYAFTYEEILTMAPSDEEELKKNLEPGLTDVLFHGFSSAYALEQIRKNTGIGWLNQSCIWNGADGLSLLSDSLITNNEMVDMVLRYSVDIPFLPGDAFRLLCVQRVRIRTFTGFMPPGEDEGRNDSKEQRVYIAEKGRVYHTNKYCSHLNLSVKTVNTDNLETLRNSNGGKYYACELCTESGENGAGNSKVYVTLHGDRYHYSTDCPGLKRSWKEIPISEAEGRSLCTRCQKQQQ